MDEEGGKRPLIQSLSSASVVRHVLAFQVLSRAYDFDYHPDVFSKLQQLQFLDNAEIRKARVPK